MAKAAGAPQNVVVALLIIGGLAAGLFIWIMFMLGAPSDNDEISDPVIAWFLATPLSYKIFALIVLSGVIIGAIKSVQQKDGASKYLFYAAFAIIVIILAADAMNQGEDPDSKDTPSEKSKTDSSATKGPRVLDSFRVSLGPYELSPEYKEVRGECAEMEFPKGVEHDGDDVFDTEFTGKDYEGWISDEDWAYMDRQGQAPFEHSTKYRIRNKKDFPITVIVKKQRYGTCM